MHIESLTFANFRNYAHFELSDIGKLTIFTGPNAVGKTNILEGIQLLTSASSFRHPQIVQLIREGDVSARIALDAGDGNRRMQIALSLEAAKRRYTVNGKAKAAADVRGVLPSVMFTPDDLQLAKKSSGVKREAIDDLGMQLTRNYYIVRRDYEKTVRYKNRLLRDEASRALIESINETLVTCGSQLYCYRRALFDRLIMQVVENYSQLAASGERLSAQYRPSWQRMGIDSQHEATKLDGGESKQASPTQPASPEASDWSDRQEEQQSAARRIERSEVRDQMVESLHLIFDEERRRKRSLVGPHNDEIIFELDGRNAALFASQGQQRSIVLAWKLAEVGITREVLGMNPVLLLDDVLSELDESRREMLVRFVTSEIQTFITATDLAGFSDEFISHAHVIDLPQEDRSAALG